MEKVLILVFVVRMLDVLFFIDFEVNFLVDNEMYDIEDYNGLEKEMVLEMELFISYCGVRVRENEFLELNIFVGQIDVLKKRF